MKRDEKADIPLNDEVEANDDTDEMESDWVSEGSDRSDDGLLDEEES